MFTIAGGTIVSSIKFCQKNRNIFRFFVCNVGSLLAMVPRNMYLCSTKHLWFVRACLHTFQNDSEMIFDRTFLCRVNAGKSSPAWCRQNILRKQKRETTRRRANGQGFEGRGGRYFSPPTMKRLAAGSVIPLCSPRISVPYPRPHPLSYLKASSEREMSSAPPSP